MNEAKAQETALQCLGWLIGNDDLRGVFMNASGVDETDLRDRLTDPEFLAAVLDFLMMDDAWLIGCCDALSLPYDTIARARAALPGGQHVNWT